eukprot:Selendium_serpulae@DN3757_c0_g1_i1.p3
MRAFAVFLSGSIPQFLGYLFLLLGAMFADGFVNAAPPMADNINMAHLPRVENLEMIDFTMTGRGMMSEYEKPMKQDNISSNVQAAFFASSATAHPNVMTSALTVYQEYQEE